MLGFAPLPNSSSITSGEIKISKDSIELINGKKFKFESKINGKVESGTYKVALKQVNPTWYASDDYFTNRGIEIPAQGSKSRMLKGALGKQAIFFGDSYAIYSAPVSSEEVNGVAVNNEAITELFNALNVGGKIEVKN